MSLEKVYVSLSTKTPRPRKPDEKSEGLEGFAFLDEDEKTLSVVEALVGAPDKRMILLGLPGAGKSTFVRHLALQMAQALCHPETDLSHSLPGWTGSPLQPLIVPLGALADAMPADVTSGDAHMIERYIAADLDSDESLKGYAPALIEGIRQSGGLLLFDGLDEVAERRQIIREAIEDFVEQYSGTGTVRFLVTCRTYSYTDDRWKLAGWPVHEIAPLSQSKIQEFVKAWYGVLSFVDSARSIEYARFQDKMLLALDPSDRRRLAEIAANPRPLTIMAVVHTNDGVLPDTRALVYERCIDILLTQWETRRRLGKTVEKRTLLDAMDVPRIALEKALQEIAYRAHAMEHGVSRSEGEGEAALITEGLIVDVLQSALNDLDKVETFLGFCTDANGLLLLQGTASLPDAPSDAPLRRIYALPHMTFEEYLAGRYLGRLPKFATQVRHHLHRSDRSREPVVFLGEHLCFREGDDDKLDMMLNKLVPGCFPAKPSAEDWRCAWVAGDLLMLYRRALQDKPESDARVIGALRMLVSTGALTAPERAAAGRTLSILGDPRPGTGTIEVAGVGSVPDIQWCLVPGGPFLMGSTSDVEGVYEDEQPQFEYTRLDRAYHIARYPVTNAQFGAFVDDDAGYRIAATGGRRPGWHGARIARARETSVRLSRLDNHPAVGITFYEAVAWCTWASERLRQAGLLAEGWVLRLPSEAEWEKAARGGYQVPSERRLTWFYSARSLMPRIPGSTPTRPPLSLGGQEIDPEPRQLRRYRASAARRPWAPSRPVSSPYGCLDMAGNVVGVDGDEVDRELRGLRPRQDNDLEGDARRVVRGGSFDDNQGYCRCACRVGCDAATSSDDPGFRVVVAPDDSDR